MRNIIWLLTYMMCLHIISCGNPTNNDDKDISLGEPIYSDNLLIQYDKEGIEFDSVFTITTSITPKFTMKGKYNILKLNALKLLSPPVISIVDSNSSESGSSYFEVDFKEGEKHTQKWELHIPKESRSSVASYINSGSIFDFSIFIDSVFVAKDTLYSATENYIIGPRWYSSYEPPAMSFFDRLQNRSGWFYIPFKK